MKKGEALILSFGGCHNAKKWHLCLGWECLLVTGVYIALLNEKLDSLNKRFHLSTATFGAVHYMENVRKIKHKMRSWVSVPQQDKARILNLFCII